MYRFNIKIVWFFIFAQVAGVAYLQCMDQGKKEIENTRFKKINSLSKIVALFQPKPEVVFGFLFTTSWQFCKYAWDKFVYHFAPPSKAWIEERLATRDAKINAALQAGKKETSEMAENIKKQFGEVRQELGSTAQKIESAHSILQSNKIFIEKNGEELAQKHQENARQLDAVQQKITELTDIEISTHQQEQIEAEKRSKELEELKEGIKKIQGKFENNEKMLDELSNKEVSEKAQDIWKLLKQCERENEQKREEDKKMKLEKERERFKDTKKTETEDEYYINVPVVVGFNVSQLELSSK